MAATHRKKVGTGQQKAGKVNDTNKKQLEGQFATNSHDWYKKNILENIS